MSQQLVRVLVVDDSALIRSIVERALSQHPQIQVVGQAADGIEALRQIAALRPDVVTLDVEMPRMNGIAVLERAAGKVPVSFVMVSTLTQSGAQVTFEALNKGAFDYVTKPTNPSRAARPEFQKSLHRKVLAAARAKGRVRQLTRTTWASAAPSLPPCRSTGWVVAIGISCGGPQTLHKMLPAFPSNFVPIVVTQHMPAQFTGPFAKHLDAACAMQVREAKHGDVLQQGTILVAPGDRHVRVVRRGTSLAVELDAGPPVSGHRPSVDVMFNALARSWPQHTIGVIMTGMGRDGADGLAALANAGGVTVAQDEASSLVYGMPKAAVATGRVRHVAGLTQIPTLVSRLMEGSVQTAGAGR